MHKHAEWSRDGVRGLKLQAKAFDKKAAEYKKKRIARYESILDRMRDKHDTEKAVDTLVEFGSSPYEKHTFRVGLKKHAANIERGLAPHERERAKRQAEMTAARRSKKFRRTGGVTIRSKWGRKTGSVHDVFGKD